MKQPGGGGNPAAGFAGGAPNNMMGNIHQPTNGHHQPLYPNPAAGMNPGGHAGAAVGGHGGVGGNQRPCKFGAKCKNI